MLNIFHKIFCGACFLFSLSFAHSQDLIYKHYDLQDGLASPTIHSIFQDKDGFIWFGTESGLCRYDGKQFKTFTVKDGLPGNEVFGMLQDKKGRIWLQQYGTTIAYIYKGKVFNQQNDSLLKRIKLVSRVFGMAEDSEGNIGLCDSRALFIIDKGLANISTLSVDSKPLNAVYLYTNNAGQIMVCTIHDLYVVEGAQLKYIKTISPVNELSTNNILVQDNYLVYGFYNKVRNIYLRDTTLAFTLPVDFILKHSAISDSVFSFNTIDGAFLFNINTYRFLRLLPGVKVTNVLLDMEKNLWIGTIGKGVYKVSSQVIVNKGIDDGSDDISFITKEDDKIIMGNNNTELYEYTGTGFVKRGTPRFRESVIWKIFFYEKMDAGIHLVVNAMGVMHYSNGSIKKDLFIPAVKQVKKMEKSHVIIASGGGVFQIRTADLQVDTIWDRKCNSLLATNDSILVGTPGGMFILKKENTQYKIVDSLLQHTIVSFIEKTSDDLIWIATYEHGLYCMKDGKIVRHFTDTSGLPSNNGRSLHADGAIIWLGTDQGLVKIKPEANDFSIQKFSTSDGLSSNIINAIYVDGQTVYMGTPEGMCYFDESKIETTSICNLVLTGVKIGNNVMELQDEYSPGRNQGITIEYSGLSFRSEQEMSYRYRIHGIDESWRNTDLNSLEFTFLPYGTYELEIVATNKFGKESQPVKIKFLVQRPFYKTTWFIVLLIAVIISGILFLYNRRARMIRRRQVLKLQQELKTMELEQMALRAQMNPHFIFNCINAMQQLVAENDTENAQRFITSFSTLVRQTLDNAAELFIPLDEEIKFLGNYFELERIQQEDRFAYAIETTGITDIHQWRVPNMIIQPFVENAIRHGLRYKKDAPGFVTVVFTQQHAMLRCIITDNGVGRAKAALLRKENGIHHQSKAMGITFQRMESLNTLTEGNIAIDIEDMEDEMGTASGTKVTIEFHKINDHYDKNSNNRR